jgi:threonine synthase
VTAPLVQGLACRECGALVPAGPVHVCELCFGPLDIRYDQAEIGRRLTRAVIESRPPTMWRYAELLPLDGPPLVGLATGMTPLVRAERLGARLGIAELWIKNEAVCHPTLSFKDRVVAVALAKARELGISVAACASTGNLANATAALAAAAGMKCLVVVPADIEPARVLATSVYGAQVVAVRGTYDDANRLCSEIADRHGWAVVNINLRPYYGEGSKTLGYEIAEQLGWRLPGDVVVPMAGGSLLTKIDKAFGELQALGLVPRGAPRLHGAQPAGCAPIASMIIEGRSTVVPVQRPRTIARALAVGDPGDGHYAGESIRGSGGFAAAPDDEAILQAVRLLAESEGIFADTGAAVAVAALPALLAAGKLAGDGPVVVCITGQGLKTADALAAALPPAAVIEPRLAAFEAHLAGARGGLV